MANIIITNFINSTSFIIEANILTELSIADLLFGALSITGAGHRLAHTAHHRRGVRDVTSWTATLSTVVHYLAVSARTTGVNCTGI